MSLATITVKCCMLPGCSFAMESHTSSQVVANSARSICMKLLQVAGWLATSLFPLRSASLPIIRTLPFCLPYTHGLLSLFLFLFLSLFFSLVTLNTDHYYYEDRSEQTATTAVGKEKLCSSSSSSSSRSSLKDSHAHPLGYFNFLLIRCHLINIAIHSQSLSRPLCTLKCGKFINKRINRNHGHSVKTLASLSLFLSSPGLFYFLSGRRAVR